MRNERYRPSIKNTVSHDWADSFLFSRNPILTEYEIRSLEVMRSLYLLLVFLAVSSTFVLPLSEIFGDGRPRSERSLSRYQFSYFPNHIFRPEDLSVVLKANRFSKFTTGS